MAEKSFEGVKLKVTPKAYSSFVSVSASNDNIAHSLGKLKWFMDQFSNGAGGITIPTAALPSYVDDVIEAYYHNNVMYEDAEYTTPITADKGKIYVDLSTEKIYRWGGTTYVEISKCEGFTPTIMTGAGASTDGATGYVPKPVAGDNTAYLRGDGTWSKDPVVTSDTIVLNCVQDVTT